MLLHLRVQRLLRTAVPALLRLLHQHEALRLLPQLVWQVLRLAFLVLCVLREVLRGPRPSFRQTRPGAWPRRFLGICFQED